MNHRPDDDLRHGLPDDFDGPDPDGLDDDDESCDCSVCRGDADVPGDLVSAALIFLRAHVRPFGTAGPEIGRDGADDAIPEGVRADLGKALASAARFLGRTFDGA